MDILSLMASPGGFRSNFVSALGIDLEYLAIIFFPTFLVQLVFHCIHSMAEDLGECPSDTFPSIPKMMGLDSAYVYFAIYGNIKNNVKKRSNISLSFLKLYVVHLVNVEKPIKHFTVE